MIISDAWTELTGLITGQSYNVCNAGSHSLRIVVKNGSPTLADSFTKVPAGLTIALTKDQKSIWLYAELATEASISQNSAGEISVNLADGPQLDSFSRLKVSSPFGIYESKQIHNRGITEWEERIWGAIIVHGVVTGAGFQVGETITGVTSGETGTITQVNAGSIVYSIKEGNDFVDGETITGGTSLSTAVVTTHNTGSDIVYNYDRSSTSLKVGTAIGDRVVRQTVRYFPYVPGKSHHITMTGIKALGKVGLRQYMMYGDDLNGIGYCLDDVVLSILTRTSTTGSIVDTLIPQSAWNIDKLDGSGISGITLDPEKSQIDGFDFQWLGVGRVRFSFNIGGKSIIVHEINHANVDDVVYMKTPTLPVRYEIVNTGATASASTLEQICCSVSSDGGYLLHGFESSSGNPITSRVAVTTRRPIFAIRLKNNFTAGKPNRRDFRLINWFANAKTNAGLFELVHVHGVISSTATWTDNGAYSAIEYSTDISALTAMEYHVVQRAIAESGVGVVSSSAMMSSEFVNNHSFISQNFESTGSQMFVIYATSEAGTCNALAGITGIESE
jgi:hypothetical protein